MRNDLVALMFLVTAVGGKVNLKKAETNPFVVPYQKMDGSVSISFSVDNSLIGVAQVDQSLNYTFVTDVFYTSASKKLKPIDYQTKNIHGINLPFEVINKEISFTNYLKGNFNLILYHRGEKLYTHSMDSIGLAHSYHDYSFSLLHQMKNQKLVNELSYAFVPNENGNGMGGIYFGGVPKETLAEANFLGKCKVDEKDDSWSCKLKNIKIGEEYFSGKETSDITFQVFEGKQLVTEEFFFTLVNKVLKEYIKKESCVVRYESNRFLFLDCYCSVLKDFPEITFNLDDFTFTIPLGKLFYKRMSVCNSMFQLDPESKSSFTIGGYLLEYFISKFNYFDNSVELYTKFDFINKYKSKNKNFSIIRRCIVFLFLLLLFFTCFLLDKKKFVHKI